MAETAALTYPELALHPRPLAGVRYPHPSLEDTYQPGTTEPYVAQLVCALLVASGGRTVLETGGFMGTTSAWLALTLESMGGGILHIAEIDPSRAAIIEARMESIRPGEDAIIHRGDVMDVIRASPDDYFDFVWLDDSHEQQHVAAEIEALWPKVKRGGLIVGHDIDEPCNLHEVFTAYGGYSIRLPKLGPAGGIGVIQKP